MSSHVRQGGLWRALVIVATTMLLGACSGSGATPGSTGSRARAPLLFGPEDRRSTADGPRGTAVARG